MGFSIREVELSDYESIGRIDENFDYTKIKFVLEDKESLMMVAQLNDDIIGYINTRASMDSNYNDLEVRGIVVDEKYRALGVGSRLITNIEGKAREKNINCLIITNRKYNEDETIFYNKVGFILDSNFRFIKEINKR